MPDPEAIPLPQIKGETTEDTVGALFDEWWSETGGDLFVTFCREKGLPVLDASDIEADIEQEKSRHDKFFESA